MTKNLLFRALFKALDRNQTGQVLAETVITLLLMSVFLMALHQVGKQFYQWFKWSDQVHQVTHKKSIFPDLDLTLGMNLVSVHRDRTHTVMQSQWGLGQRNWVSVEVESPYKHHASFLSGIGATSTHHETTARVKQNLIVWRAQALNSQAKVWLLKPGLTAIDLPWRRPFLETDWLTQWSNIEPDNIRN